MSETLVATPWPSMAQRLIILGDSKEHHLYGSSRIGIIKEDRDIVYNQLFDHIPSSNRPTDYRYELSNHLGNTLAILSGRKFANTTANSTTYRPDIVSLNDYYAFGQTMEGRSYSNGIYNDKYRYAFNGKEKDEDGEFGGLTHYDYGFRIYNPAIGKFLSVDPLAPEYPELTPYQFASNTPVQAIDLDGLEAAIPLSSGTIAIENQTARDNIQHFEFVEIQKPEPIVSVIGEDELGPYAYNGRELKEYMENRDLELFKRKADAIRNGGVVTSLYYLNNDPSLADLEAVSGIESNILNLYASPKNLKGQGSYKARNKSLVKLEKLDEQEVKNYIYRVQGGTGTNSSKIRFKIEDNPCF